VLLLPQLLEPEKRYLLEPEHHKDMVDHIARHRVRMVIRNIGYKLSYSVSIKELPPVTLEQVQSASETKGTTQVSFAC